MLWGSNAREAHPIFFHHVLKAVHRGAKLMVVDPRRTVSAQWADLWVGLDVGSDIPLANAIAREIIHERPGERGVHLPRHEQLRRVPRVGRAVDARGRRARDRRAGRRDPRARARLGQREDAADLLDARHHRAPQRRRQRLRADQSLAARRRGRPLRRRSAAAARPEQRAGRRRHGRDPEQAAGLPGRGGRGGPREVRRRLGRDRAAGEGPAPDRDVRGDGARRPARALRRRREPGAVGGRPDARAQAARRRSTISSSRTSS